MGKHRFRTPETSVRFRVRAPQGGNDMKESLKRLNGLMSSVRFYRSTNDPDTWYQFVKDELEAYTQERMKECFAHCAEQTNPLRNTTLDQDQRAVDI